MKISWTKSQKITFDIGGVKVTGTIVFGSGVENIGCIRRVAFYGKADPVAFKRAISKEVKQA